MRAAQLRVTGRARRAFFEIAPDCAYFVYLSNAFIVSSRQYLM